MFAMVTRSPFRSLAFHLDELQSRMRDNGAFGRQDEGLPMFCERKVGHKAGEGVEIKIDRENAPRTALWREVGLAQVMPETPS
jgi:hypothetical protein